jgi:hypothetical protein
MIKIAFVRNLGSRFSLLRPTRWIHAVSLVLLAAATAGAEEPIAVFPSTPYDGYIIYESLAVFWIAIIGMIVIIRMKLQEIERTQEMGADGEDQDAPLLQ